MNNDSQLATKDGGRGDLLQQLAAIRAARDQATAENTLAAVLKWLDQPRTLLKGGEGPITMTFCQVGNAVLKVCSQCSSGDFVYNVARNVVNCSRDRVTVSIAPASEGDLLDALESLKGSARLAVQEFLRIVRDEPVQPLEIRLVNASEMGRVEKAMKVSRDSDWKFLGQRSCRSVEKESASVIHSARASVLCETNSSRAILPQKTAHGLSLDRNETNGQA